MAEECATGGQRVVLYASQEVGILLTGQVPPAVIRSNDNASGIPKDPEEP